MTMDSHIQGDLSDHCRSCPYCKARIDRAPAPSEPNSAIPTNELCQQGRARYIAFWEWCRDESYPAAMKHPAERSITAAVAAFWRPPEAWVAFASGADRRGMAADVGDSQPQPKPYRPDKVRVERGDFIRVGGDMICDVCGCAYWEHAPVQGMEFLRRRCDGMLLKL